MEDKPGINGEEFKITLNKDYFTTPSIINEKEYVYEVKIIGIRRHQWYWRILHYLTLKKYFGIEYELQIIDGPKLTTK